MLLKEILQNLEIEDSGKFFCGESHPNIYDAVSAISNQCDLREIERTLKHYFEQVMQITAPSSQVYFEAERMKTVCDTIFSSIQSNSSSPNVIERRGKQESKTYNDEIVHFYLESLEHFASGLNEDILNAHIRYLKNE